MTYPGDRGGGPPPPPGQHEPPPASPPSPPSPAAPTASAASAAAALERHERERLERERLERERLERERHERALAGAERHTAREREGRGREQGEHEREAARERAKSEHAEHLSPELTTEERHKAKEATSLDAKTTHAVVLEQGEKEVGRGASALAWSGLAAGLSMGLSMAAEAMLRSRLPDADWRPLVAKLGYPVGFLAVILGSQQLFTENTLTPVVPYLSKKSDVTLAQVLRLWAIVLVANVLGTFLFALVAAKTTTFPDAMRGAFAALGTEAVANPFWTTFARAVGAGWIIALMMWMLPDAKDARFWVIIVMTYVIGAAQLSHIVAGSAEAFFVALNGTVGWDTFFVNFFLPTLIGNVLGGTVLVAALNHGQVEG